MKKVAVLVFVLSALALALGIAACGEEIHSFSAWETVREATCTEEGEQRRVCADCGYEQTRSIKAKGHKAVVSRSKQPTCTEDGYTAGSYCSVCGTVFTEPEKLPKHGHFYGGWEPVGDGTHRRVCIYGDDAQTEPCGYETHTVAATCEEGGYTEHICTSCGDRITDSPTPSLGHDFEGAQYLPNGDGTHTRFCRRAGCTASETSACRMHEQFTLPSCTADGELIDTCADCGYETRSLYQPATGHSYGPFLPDAGAETHTCICQNCDAKDTQPCVFTADGGGRCAGCGRERPANAALFCGICFLNAEPPHDEFSLRARSEKTRRRPPSAG